MKATALAKETSGKVSLVAMATQSAISLTELQEQIKQALDKSLAPHYWVTAEINEIKINQTGHCYLALIEKEEDDALPKAKVSATIWEYSLRLIRAHFESSTGQALTAGLKIMVKTAVQYHPLYGLSLNITDIDPAYTVGSMAIQRHRTIAGLEAEGVFHLNHELPFPELPQRIAVVSSEQAAGYQDFVQQLYENEYGYGFRITLFPSLMQGERAAQSMIEALDQINACKDAFDVVVIIRGGGAVADLMCFDDANLASHVAQFPLPVLTGVGHDKDESVVDMVAHRALKTPTAVADFLVDCLSEEASVLEEYGRALSKLAHHALHRERQDLNLLQQHLLLYAGQRLQQENFNLQLYANTIESCNPYHILSRGYAMARFRNRALTSAATVHAGDEVEVILHKGKLQTVVKSA
ncbi:MAG: exodeoxyribonuclease VII large subunit [Prevotellaceae bacterium]|nr:exodeoxyribonuclease VII large subunit [Prevotellaceae bacterium]